MLKEEKIQRTITENKRIWTCDICERNANTTCINCKKDLCKKHSREDDSTGDYPDFFCPDCYKKYRHFKDNIEPMYNNMLEQEYERIMKI